MPARDAAHLRVLKGNDDGPQRRPRPTPKPPSCPTWMPVDGKRAWKRLVPILDDLGILSTLDEGVLAGFCASYARMVEAEREVTRDGVTIEGYRGSRVKHPALQIVRDSRSTLLSFARELGLTPKARELLSMPLVDDDPDDDLLD